MNEKRRYRGRFAPSPTGPLHFGSLVAAAASYCQARAQQGQWWLRIEDIDRSREIPGSGDEIIRTLEVFGFKWDAISYQKERLEYYLSAFEQLSRQQRVYPCTCSRKDIAKLSPQRIYSGTCRSGHRITRPIRSWRIQTETAPVTFTDRIQGDIKVNLSRECGDFILKRADGIFSYQLAVAVDDATQGMTEVMRGYDLLDSTSRQIYLQQQLDYPSPIYAHHPIAVGVDGDKLSKQSFAPAIKPDDAQKQIYRALQFLGQTPPEELQYETIENIWIWAIKHWHLDDIPKCGSIESII